MSQSWVRNDLDHFVIVHIVIISGWKVSEKWGTIFPTWKTILRIHFKFSWSLTWALVTYGCDTFMLFLWCVQGWCCKEGHNFNKSFLISIVIFYMYGVFIHWFRFPTKICNSWVFNIFFSIYAPLYTYSFSKNILFCLTCTLVKIWGLMVLMAKNHVSFLFIFLREEVLVY